MKKYILFVVPLVVGALIYINLPLSQNPTIDSLDKEYWANAVEKNGAQNAYEEFKVFNHKAPFEKQHLETHIIGELLYEYEDVEGIIVCDSSFGFGCYHGFFGTALADQGIGIVSKLDKICIDTYGPLGGGCIHGIGHGIIEYMGYDNLSGALEVCKETTQITKTIGCTSGVFMEYNTPLVFSDNNVRTGLLPFDPESPYGACTEVAKEFQASCYFELAQWWSAVLNDDNEKMATLCDGVSDLENRKYCTLGVGSMIAISSRFDVTESIRKCSFVSPDEETICLAGVTWSFFADPKHKEEARELCDGLSYNERELCILEADLTEGLDSLYKTYFE